MFMPHQVVKHIWTIIEYVGWISVVLIAIEATERNYGYTNCTSIISRVVSPDGNFLGMIKDCWPQSGPEQEMMVILARPTEEGRTALNNSSCNYDETTMLSVDVENIKNRPILRWSTPNRLEVSIPDNSKIKLFRTTREGISVNLLIETSDDQKQRRRNETSNEPDDPDEQSKIINWKCVY